MRYRITTVNPNLRIVTIEDHEGLTFYLERNHTDRLGEDSWRDAARCTGGSSSLPTNELVELLAKLVKYAPSTNAPQNPEPQTPTEHARTLELDQIAAELEDLPAPAATRRRMEGLIRRLQQLAKPAEEN